MFPALNAISEYQGVNLTETTKKNCDHFLDQFIRLLVDEVKMGTDAEVKITDGIRIFCRSRANSICIFFIIDHNWIPALLCACEWYKKCKWWYHGTVIIAIVVADDVFREFLTSMQNQSQPFAFTFELLF